MCQREELAASCARAVPTCRRSLGRFALLQTLNRQVALRYAEGDAGIVLQIEQGAVARGASLQWLSQYPHEAELTFPPLTMCAQPLCTRGPLNAFVRTSRRWPCPQSVRVRVLSGWR